jgi:hypothetical protein
MSRMTSYGKCRFTEAGHSGETVGRDQVKATIENLHGIVDSGAFQETDQKQLDQDFKSLKPQ